MKLVQNSKVELKMIVNQEFKKEIIAFANTDGGEIYVGIDNDGTIIGIDHPELEMERISNMIHDGIHPDLIPFTSIELIEVEGKKLIRVTVNRGGRIPYHLTDKGLKPSGVYVRHGITSIPASEEQIRDMIRQSDGITFDKSRSLNQDLTFQYAKEYFVNRQIPFEVQNMRTLGLVDQDGYYTNVALLLSDQCEHSIKCAVFEGTGKTIFKTRKEFFGSVLKQLEDAYEYISLFNHVHSDFVGLSRIDEYEYPSYALREALLNTIVHRDYNYSGSTIINIFSNRMEFVSIGGLVKGITLKDIMHGVSQSRNMILANVFYRLKLIESYGTGIQRILESYIYQAQPQFLIETSSFVTVLPNLRKYETQHNKISVRESGNPEEEVMRLFEIKEIISRKDVQELLQCSEFPARKVLNTLLEKNKIRTIGNARATRYILK